ncbi:hypothetical protein JCM1841_005062 [Sporobolomyces salmonicolor]
MSPPAPTPLPPRAASPPTPPPALTAPTSSSGTPISFLASISSSPVPANLIVTTLAVLLAGGFLVRTFHPKYRYRSTPVASTKGNKKRRQDVLKSILQAQEADKASADDGAPTAGGSRNRADSSAGADGRRSSLLLPSTACVASTSAAIMIGLEKLGGALASTASGSKGATRQRASSLSEGLEPPSPTLEEKNDGKGAGDAFASGANGLLSPDALTKRGRGKKGKGVAMPVGTGGKAGGLGGDSSTPSLSRSPARRPSVREFGVMCEMGRFVLTAAEMSDAGVQASLLEQIPPSPAPDVTPTPTCFELPAPSPQPLEDPPLPLPPPPSDPPSFASVFVQTSPSLITCRPPSPSPLCSRSHSSLPISAPAPTRPPVLPLPFDLHASFQSTPPSHSLDYPAPTSPPLSPTPSRSVSSVPSTSSGSPTGRRSSSPTARRSSGVAANLAAQASGNIAISSSKSRKQARKASAAAATGAGGKAVVGLPKAPPTAGSANGSGSSRSREPTEEVEASAHRAGNGGSGKTNGRGRPAPIPIPPSPAVGGPPALRRLSTASSSASYSTSSVSLTSGSPYSSERAQLPSMPPAMTMTPPDSMRRSSVASGYDRDDTLRWSASANGRGGVAGLRGLGVDMDNGGGSEDGSIDGGDRRSRGESSACGSSPNPHHGYFPLSSSQSRSMPPSTTSFTSPESSPHPSHRSISHNSFSPSTSSLGTPSSALNAQRPWSPQMMAQQYTMIPYPFGSSSGTPTASTSNLNGSAASRPPSRQSSLSVPPSLSQQQIHLQQQQQQAFALAQAQAQAQYQHAVALQLQARAQAHAQQQQQHRQRRRTGDDVTMYDTMSPTSSASATPNGLVYPLGSSASASAAHWGASSHPTSPLMPNVNHLTLSQSVSPTSTTFPPSAVAAHAQAQAQAHAQAQAQTQAQAQAQMYSYYLNSPAAAYHFAASQAAAASSAHSHHHSPRPRISSSVSAVAVLGSSSKSTSSPASASKTSASPRIGTGNEKQRSASSSGTSGGPSNGVNGQASTPTDLPAWKAKLKAAEMEVDRTAKELEIARWRLAVLEEEQRASELENQEALKALATRAMRAEARIKLFEETRRAETAIDSSSTLISVATGLSTSGSPSTRPASLNESAELPGLGPRNGEKEGQNGRPAEGDEELKTTSSLPSQTMHPLAWLDLDSVSFSTRQLTPSRPSNFLTSPNFGGSRKRNGRNSHGGGGGGATDMSRRRSTGANRRKSGNSPSPPMPAEEEEDDEDVVIVLDAPGRRNPRQQPLSRRVSYLADDDTLDQDGSSFADEEEVPSIDVDEAEPIVGGSIFTLNGGGDMREHPEYIGFLPSFLSPNRAASSSFGISPRLDATSSSNEDPDVSSASIPSFFLDASPPTEEPESLADHSVTSSETLRADEHTGSPSLEVELPPPLITSGTEPSSVSSDERTPRTGPPSAPTSPVFIHTTSATPSPSRSNGSAPSPTLVSTSA